MHYEINWDEAQESICKGCGLVKCVHSGWTNGEFLDEPDYDCPLNFNPQLEFDAEEMILFCGMRGKDE
jgi:hypothetical protein